MKYLSLTILILVFALSALGQKATALYTKYELKDIGTIEIPSIMELQAGVYKEFSDKTSVELGFDASGSIIFQQAGRNNTSSVSTTYARVILNETIGKKGDYRKITSKLVLSNKQLKEVDSFLKSGIEQANSSTKIKIVRWDGASVATLNGRSVLKVAYLRQLETNPPVFVEIYRIENYDREYIFTISYREKDASIWKDALTKVKDSFTVTNIR